LNTNPQTTDLLLNCKIIDDAPNKALIEADIGRAWFDRSEFKIVKIGFGEPDQIMMSEKLAIERGIL
jgi:hypothetical protein